MKMAPDPEAVSLIATPASSPLGGTLGHESPPPSNPALSSRPASTSPGLRQPTGRPPPGFGTQPRGHRRHRFLNDPEEIARAEQEEQQFLIEINRRMHRLRAVEGCP
jgi:hypothetical protein